MDKEGHKSQQDVVGEVKKHPWEEKPEVVVPTSESERVEHAKINDLEKKKARRAKRQARKAKFFGFVKGHKKAVIASVIVFVLLVAGGVTAVILLNQPKNGGEGSWQRKSPFPEDMTAEKAPTPEYAFDFVQTKLVSIATRDVVPSGSSTTDTAKIEDQANAFIDTLDSDYEKFFYRVYLPVIIASRGDTERAKELMDELKPQKMVLDKKQRYMFLESMRVYWSLLGDEELSKKFDKFLLEEYPPEDRG